MVNLNKKLMSDTGLLKMIVFPLIWLILEVEAAWEIYCVFMIFIHNS